MSWGDFLKPAPAHSGFLEIPPMKRRTPRHLSPDDHVVPAQDSAPAEASARAESARLEQELSHHPTAPQPGTLARLQRYLCPDSGPAAITTAKSPSKRPTKGPKPGGKAAGYSLFSLAEHPDSPSVVRPTRRASFR